MPLSLIPNKLPQNTNESYLIIEYMGNEKSADEVTVPTGCKLYSTMSLTSPH